jgi:hypothetical protein
MYYPVIGLEGLRKPTKSTVMIACVPARIRSEHLLNANVQRYRYANLLGLHDVDD